MEAGNRRNAGILLEPMPRSGRGNASYGTLSLGVPLTHDWTRPSRPKVTLDDPHQRAFRDWCVGCVPCAAMTSSRDEPTSNDGVLEAIPTVSGTISLKITGSASEGKVSTTGSA